MTENDPHASGLAGIITDPRNHGHSVTAGAGSDDRTPQRRETKLNPPASQHPPLSDCTGIILAGGLSTRLGQPKSEIVWLGRSLIAHVADRLRRVTGEVVAVARAEQESSIWPVDRVICDDPDQPAGPLRGIVAGLRGVQSTYAMICSCDSPLIDPRLCTALREQISHGHCAVVPVWKGWLQPLAALYAVSAVGALSHILRQGEHSPNRALSRLSILTLSEEACRRIDPYGLSFLNFNTMEDLTQLDAYPTPVP